NGLEPLADALLADPTLDPQAMAAGYLTEQVADAAAALEGARAILVERFAEDADLIGSLRERMWSRGRLVSRVREGQQEAGAKFADYFEFSEPFAKLPSHRILALFRGEKEGVLDLSPEPEDEDSHYEQAIAARFGVENRGRPADPWLAEVVHWAWRTRILLHLGIDQRTRLRQAAETEAVRVFAANLRDLLLAAPAGARPTMGLDPGYRTGVKVAVVDATGKVVATETVYPHVPQQRWDETLAVLSRLAKAHDVELIAIGNGTASRETDKLAGQLGITKAVVSEAGASVYSASAYATSELPDLDVSLRGAVSIARRLQDPLAELVKIDPKSIGVGQYQHDLPEAALSRSLDAVVEDCVNAVGVDVNTASAPLLRRVSGITGGLAENIVAHRDAHGPFRTRTALADVQRLGPKAFEQCAGFLRILGGDDPLDSSAVHPESYPVVRRILAAAGTEITTLTARRSDRLSRLSNKIVAAMGEFRRQNPVETAELDDSLDSTDGYRELHGRLTGDDLPRFRQQFKTYLNQNTIRDIAGFQSQLNKQSELIRERIATINSSLVGVDYNPGRYIRLEPLPSPHGEIRDFRGDLRACTDDAVSGEDSDHYSEQKFLQVSRIIERFRGREGMSEADQRWTRFVTDVRNWYTFAASERYREDDEEYEHYADSGGKSGGQKEKLAYTILAASLAYQFKLEWGTAKSRTFRFAVIDEAFGRGSDESTRFALELFGRLGLQLLIVTPLQKIHVIEPYVSAVGFVDNPRSNNSRLQTLTIEEYQARRAAHQLAQQIVVSDLIPAGGN
ncbi:MAG TPA: helix-hairpin-helix domain-containing protein, partial [Gemmataceae bacterium]|nr:helix-hairpin-helix domain-containing protein [Gemmataceae bacterium]